MTSPDTPEYIYRPTCGLIVLHHVFDSAERRDRARSINAVSGGLMVVGALAVYKTSDTLLAPFTFGQSLALVVFVALVAMWLIEALIVAFCRPVRIFLRWPKSQSVSKTLEETWRRPGSK